MTRRHTEIDPRGPRFAAALTTVVLAVAILLKSAELVGFTSTAFALGAAFLSAAFGRCLGCELYLLLARATGRPLSRRVRIS